MPIDIMTPQPYLKVYPNPETVFGNSVTWCARHLLPLVSIELSSVNPSWSGWVHMINPCEPFEGTIGCMTQSYHSYYCRDNWIGFHLDKDNKYEWLGNWRYFLLENDLEDLPDMLAGYPKQTLIKEMQEDYERQYMVYKLAKDNYAQQQLLYSPSYLDPESGVKKRPDKPERLIDQLGGGQSWGNWISSSDMPLDKSNTDDIVPVTPNGERFHFIAGVPAYHYCATGADWILLFYEPNTRTVLLTFDWS